MKNNSKNSWLNISEIYLNLSKKNENIYQNKQPKITTLGEVIYVTKEKNKNHKADLILSVSNTSRCVPQTNRFKHRVIASHNLSKYKVLKRGDFAYNPAAITTGSIGMLKDFDLGIVSPMYVTFSLKKDLILPNYLELFFKTDVFKNETKSQLEGGVRILLTFKGLLKIKIKLPSLEMQKAICEFLEVISKAIKNEENKKSFWNCLIKRITQKTFEKNKNLKNYYVLKGELKKFFESFSGMQGLNSHNFMQKGNKYLPFKKIFNQKVCDHFDLLDFRVNNKKQNVIKQNDILVTISSETQNEVGICSLYNSNVEAYLNSFCFGIRLRPKYENRVYPKYVNAALSWEEYRKEIYKLSNGSTRYNLSKPMFFALKIKLPNYQTQVKIADLFYKIYDLINFQKKIIEQLKKIEKFFINALVG